jgi:DNA polymerase I-like protein with 3'-5' exonuclease and polymerase domains
MQYTDVQTAEQAISLNDSLPPIVAFDVETTGLNPRVDRILCFSIAWGEQAYRLPAEFLPLLSELKTRLLILHNFKFDFQFCYNAGFDLSDTPFLDTMLLHHLLDEEAEHSLDYLVKAYFNDDYKEAFWGKYKSFAEASVDDGLQYVCKDTIYTFKLGMETFKDRAPQKLVEHVHRLAHALYLTERDGVRVNVPFMLETKEKMGGEIAGYLPKLREVFSEYCNAWELDAWVKEMDKRKTDKGKANVPKPSFNFGSDKQVSWLLYEALKLPVLKKTKKNNPAADYETVEKLCEKCPELAPLKDYKAIKTLYSNFVEGLLDRVEDGRIYPSFNINGTVTGRISHSGPNMGNMPTDGPFRSFFLPDDNQVIIGADYTQLEVVVAANFSGDKNLTRSLMEGISLHDITAEGLGIKRDVAKTINFAVQYGAGPHKIAKILKCTFQDAEGVLRKYWETYSGLKSLVDECHRKLECGEPIVNPFGRARHFKLPEDYETKWQYEEAKRQAFNSLTQGTGGDITHMAFYRCQERLKKLGRGRMLWEVHDEILGSVNKSSWEEESQAMVKIMEEITHDLGFKIPLIAKPYGPFEAWSKA